MDIPGFWTALGLTLLAGLSTGIGSILAFGARRDSYRFLSVSTGFSAGVMLYVSFVEILPKGGKALSDAFGVGAGPWHQTGWFFGGVLFIGLIDFLLPHGDDPHEQHAPAEAAPLRAGSAPHAPHPFRLHRMALFTALAIALHNFPEGLATFLAAIEDPHVGAAIAIAIALHNIPEGMSISVPLYYATGSRATAFLWSFLSGLAEPVGALIGFFGLRAFIGSDAPGLPPAVMGASFAAVAGIMVFISIDQLLPTSRAYGKGHDSILGLLGGMVVMALSLLLFKVA